MKYKWNEIDDYHIYESNPHILPAIYFRSDKWLPIEQYSTQEPTQGHSNQYSSFFLSFFSFKRKKIPSMPFHQIIRLCFSCFLLPDFCCNLFILVTWGIINSLCKKPTIAEVPCVCYFIDGNNFIWSTSRMVHEAWSI